jgi:hypothetical protein
VIHHESVSDLPDELGNRQLGSIAPFLGVLEGVDEERVGETNAEKTEDKATTPVRRADSINLSSLVDLIVVVSSSGGEVVDEESHRSERRVCRDRCRCMRMQCMDEQTR